MEMTMKTNRLFITVMMAAIFSCGNMLAQNAQAPNQKKKLTPEQRQEMQINRMQKSLLLDDETAAKFAPLYKEYLEALKACRTEMKQEKPQQRKAERTDAEIKKQLEERLAKQKKVVETKQTYLAKFEKILNARQLEKLFAAPRHNKHMQAGPCAPQCNKKPMRGNGCPLQHQPGECCPR